MSRDYRTLRSGGLFNSIISSLKRSGSQRAEPAPEPEDLGLKTLRQVYSSYSSITNQTNKQRQICKLLPLFCTNCAKYKGQALVTKFPEVYEFAANVAEVFVAHVRQAAQASTMASRALYTLKFFEPNADVETCGVGYTILRVLLVLLEGPESLVEVVTTGGVCAVLVQCLSLFLELPSTGCASPGSLHDSPRFTSLFGSHGSPLTLPTCAVPTYGSLRTPPTFMDTRARPVYDSPSSDKTSPTWTGSQDDPEMQMRHELQQFFKKVLNKLLRFTCAVRSLLKNEMLTLLFGAVSSPCANYNKIWRECASHSLITICRYSLSDEAISYIHSHGCLNFCLHNIRNALKKQPPLELVEMIATIFCCLKGSSDFSQVLLEDFSSSQGYKLLLDYLLYLETTPYPEGLEAMRNLVLLTQNLIMDGFYTLDTVLFDGGPFQDPLFKVPQPNNKGFTVRNIDAFLVLQEAFLSSRTSQLGLNVINTFLYVFKNDPANYFIVAPHHPLPTLLEVITEKDEEVQSALLKLVSHVIVELKYIPTAEMTSVGLLLQNMKEHPRTVSLCLNFLLRLISYQSSFKMVFREVGVFIMLITALKTYASDLKERHKQERESNELEYASGASPPLLLPDSIQGKEDECMFLLMECLRATIEGVQQNGQVFRENGGTRCAISLIRYSTPRKMALKLLRQLILLEDGIIDFNLLLDQLNLTHQTFVSIKAEILQTVLGVFQLDSSKKAVFREVSGFHYLISVLASLIGSLAPNRGPPWDKVPRSDILHLVQLVFTTITSAMQDDPANKNFFERDIQYDSFTAPLLLLGCFSKDSTHINQTTPTSNPGDLKFTLQISGTFSDFEAEFKTWKPPDETLDEDCFVACAAEIFRFLRDMAVETMTSQSPSLLHGSSFVSSKALRQRDKNFYGSPPITCKLKGSGSGFKNLIHPGAILCMIDLLPSVAVPEDIQVSGGMVTIPENVSAFGNRDTSEFLDTDSSSSIEMVSPVRGTPPRKESIPTTDHTHVNTSSTDCARKQSNLHPDRSSSPESASFYDAVEEVQGNNEGEWLATEGATCPGKKDDTLKVGGRGSVLAVPEWVESGACGMSMTLACKWCVFLQERVVSEVYALSTTERNQQALCQVGLPQRILSRCPGVLANEAHPLHHAMERTFEKLSYQALTPSDFRSFFRLGNPLCCSLNEVTVDNLRSKKYNYFITDSDVDDLNQPTNQNAPFGGSLSLARIQSLVTMTTSRDGCQPLIVGAPPFIEFDLSVDGFGCLFLPSVFPVLEPAALQTTPSVNAGGVGEGDRIFPPTGGLSFTAWLLVNKFSVSEPSPHLILFSLSHSISTKNNKVSHFPCLIIYLKPAQQKLIVCTHLSQNVLLEEVAGHQHDNESWKKSDAVFHCPEIFQSQSWHHVAVVMLKPGLRGRAKVTLFVNGRMIESHKMHPIQAVHASPLSAHVNESSSVLINAHIGTHVTQRHVSMLTYRLGPIFLFEEHLSPVVVATMCKLGPSYFGSFQAAVVQDITSPTQNNTLLPLISEDKVLFGLIASHPQVKTVKELKKLYSLRDVNTIRSELSLSESDDITPVTLLHNTSIHLSGSSRTLGAVMCGYSGIRFFQPQPLRSLLSSVGGTKVVLGLVAMATTVDNLYASMKALVCIVGNNPVALREMERTGGFKVLGMLLRAKSHLVNSNILHLTYTLVGTVDSEQESASIPNLIAFQDLLADFAVWSNTSEDIQRSLFNHFFELLSHMSHKLANAEHMLHMKMTSFLLYRLLDNSLMIRTIKCICNVISALLGIIPQPDDITRLGQLLATMLPSNRNINENTIDLYDDDVDPTQTKDKSRFGRFSDDAVKQRRAIILRNILLDVLISLLTRNLEVNRQFARELYHSLGFDWLFLFMHATIHTETVVRAVRILVQLLSDPQLRLHFINGDIFGSWVKDFESISAEMTNLLVDSLPNLNPFQASSQMQQIPGPHILAHLLPYHSDLSQIYLLLAATMLGRQCMEISFSAGFDMETLEDVFHIGDASVVMEYTLSGDVACVLLVMARALLHKDLADPQLQANAVNLIKFFERLYKTLPQFTLLASSQEFLEALVATLFPPVAHQASMPSVSDLDVAGGEAVKEDSSPGEGDEWIMIDSDISPGTGGKEEVNAILQCHDNLAVCTIMKLLRTIAIDGFSMSMPLTKDSTATCAILERVLTSTPPGTNPALVKQYQTLVLQTMMDYLQTGGKEDLMVVFREGALATNVERSLVGLGVFCSRVVDKVWHQYFRGHTQSVYHFLYWMVEQARKVPKQIPLMEIQRCLNRLILYQVSHIPSLENEQRSFMDKLCMFSSQAHIIFDETNVDDQFLECLLYCLLRIVLYEKFLAKNPLLVKMNSAEDEKEDPKSKIDHSMLQDRLPSGYVPGSLAMMKSGANRLWTKMLEYKREELQRLLCVELPSPLDTPREAFLGHVPSAHMVLSGSITNKTFLRLQNCHLFWTDSLEKTWKDFVSEEKYTLALESIQKEPGASGTLRKGAGLVATMASRVRRRKGTIVNKEELVHEFANVLCHLLILASQKYFEVLLRKHQRNVDYRLRFAASEWNKIEYELTRERGLWGPDKPSKLDKWMVDPVEGPCRMRKRMRRNHDFYQHYRYQPPPTLPLKSKHHAPSSTDSELQIMREKLFQRPTILATPTHLSTTSAMASQRGSEAMAMENTDLMVSAAASGSPPSPLSSTSTKLDIFNHPDSDDLIAQTLYKMIEPDDKVHKPYQCARLTGLDSREGVLLLGSTHFYVIEGITITKSGNIVDIESAPLDSYDAVVPSSINYSLHKESGKADIPIHCTKLRYDTIREVHKRRYLLRQSALEVFAVDGRSHFLIFISKHRDKICQKLLSVSKTSLPQGDSHYIAGMHPEMDPEQSQGLFSVLTGEKKLVDKWVNGEMTNFQYLMHLNTLAGRSYNDLMQYPIFPWVLADYTSETLDLTNPKVFRDLSKPMGAQTEPRLKQFIERFKYFEDPTGEETPAYYYGTHYSSAMIVASYLIRMEPFTQFFLKLQGGYFDLPDRLFHSIPDAWRSASESNMADIKELIPEFFYLPEFLVNTNNFDLGAKQSGEVLCNIVLPPWSKGDPQEFIRLHREALESDYVSANLHKWIDLIFGYKQRGEEALANHNVFHHLFYEGAVDIDKIVDPMKKMAVTSFIHNFGQMPKQLFKKTHRQRKVMSTTLPQEPPSASFQPTTIVDSQRVFYKNLVQLMPSKEPIKVIPGEVSQIVSPSDGKAPLAIDKNKLFLPWANYKYYFMWSFPDHSARIASVETDKVVAVFEGLHEGRMLCAAVANDNTLLTGGESTVVCVWDISHGATKEKVPLQLHLKHTLHGHTAAVICLVTSSNYNLIASGSKDKTCILWDMTSLSFIRQLPGHSNPVTMVTINNLNGNIVTCTKNQIRLWTVNGSLLAETPLILASSVKVLCCATSELFDWNKDNVILTGSSDGLVRMWCLEYISEEEMVHNSKLGRGSPADSLLSRESVGVESTLDFKASREQLASTVISRLRAATIHTQERSTFSPEHTGNLLRSREMFRPTGQDSSKGESDDLHMLATDLTSSQDLLSPDGSKPDLNTSPRNNTFSEDEEEKRAAGSRLDGLIDNVSFDSNKMGGDYQEEVERSQEHLIEPELKRPMSSGFKRDVCMASEEDKDGQRTPKVEYKGARGTPEMEDKGSHGTPEVEDKGSHGTPEMEDKRSHGSPEVADIDSYRTSDVEDEDCQRTPEVYDKSTAKVESAAKTKVDDKGTAKVEGGGQPNVEGEVKVDAQGTGAAMEELMKVNSAYAKYILEKRKASEELKQKTGKWVRRLKLVHTLTMHTSIHRKDNDRPAAVTCLFVSKDHKKLFVGDSRGRIYSWTVSDNLGVMQHWVLDSAANHCHSCEVEFTFTERKHHCRDCGQIFCARCSSYECEVERLRIHRKVRVCANCFHRIAMEKSRLIFRTTDAGIV